MTAERHADLGHLAPAMRAAVEATLAACAAEGLDATVFESLRDDALQREYYEKGATRAKSALFSWHGYGLAVDITSKESGWAVTYGWRARVTAIAKAHGLDWGGDWKGFPDEPHYTWGKCRASPSARARELYAAGGVEAVWRAVDAMGEAETAAALPARAVDETPAPRQAAAR